MTKKRKNHNKKSKQVKNYAYLIFSPLIQNLIVRKFRKTWILTNKMIDWIGKKFKAYLVIIIPKPDIIQISVNDVLVNKKIKFQPYTNI